MRWVLGLEYRGTAFAGWQRQPQVDTLQARLEAAIETIAGQFSTVHAAGRTDRGVHASMQVVHFDTEVHRLEQAWVRGVNSHLPDDMAVLWARPVEAPFHARFSAMRRRYRYFLYSHPVRPGLLATRVGWLHHKLSLQSMQEAASCLLGEHDFSAFRSSECQAKSPIKHLQQLSLHTHDAPGRQGELIELRFTANAFLHHMVRNMVGALVHVGTGRAPVSWMADLLASRDRSKGAPMFAADGLYLAGVEYPEVYQLPTWHDEGRLFW
ncbi:tRNA pseudouridine(38-40) synthase TruA [Leeia sp.]|uniref:tRNA pseudouridine(38-40) synthase TruA n=1 Tax=Leeia sp. TaxID=2884678 RepID=UPI0035B3864A